MSCWQCFCVFVKNGGRCRQATNFSRNQGVSLLSSFSRTPQRTRLERNDTLKPQIVYWWTQPVPTCTSIGYQERLHPMRATVLTPADSHLLRIYCYSESIRNQINVIDIICKVFGEWYIECYDAIMVPCIFFLDCGMCCCLHIGIIMGVYVNVNLPPGTTGLCSL